MTTTPDRIEWRKLQASNGDSYLGYMANLRIADIMNITPKTGREYTLHFYEGDPLYLPKLEEAKAKAEELLGEWLDKANLVVKPENCPNPCCGNSGVYPTEPDGEPEQCEWCYRHKNSVFNFLESIKPEQPEPIEWPENDLPF